MSSFYALRYLSFLCLAFLSLGKARAEEKLNVVFIISDDLGAQTLGCYGSTQCKTPNIDRLAARGMRFTRMYTQYPVCGPSRAALMSGMYPQSIGVTGNGSATRFTKNLGSRPSMSQVFKESGYYTARVSKIYHMRVPGDITAGVDGPDHADSWTERFNCRAPEWFTEGKREHLSNEKLKFLRDEHYALGFGTAFYVVKGSSDGAEQADHQAAAKAVEIIEKKKDGPFFLALGLVRPHVPLVAPASFYEPYPPSDIELAPKIENDQADIPKAGISKSSKGAGLEGELPRQRRVLSAYYASVSYMDAQVGKVLDAIDRAQLWDKTIVVFTADHGYHLGEHDLWQKMSLHEESARIPFVVATPGRGPSVSHSLTEQIDIYPTLVELAGHKVPPHVEGKSLARLFEDPTLEVRNAAYCLRRRDHLLRTKDFAFMRYRDGSEELYDMNSDPKQYTNLVENPAYGATLVSMRKRLAAKLSRLEEKK